MEIFAFARRTLPIGSKQSGHSLALIFSVLIFLLSFVVVCVFLFSHGFHSWGHKPYKITVEVPLGFQEVDTQATQERKVQNVIQDLKKHPGVVGVQAVDPERLKSMLRTWSGEADGNLNFPMPTLLDVTLDPSHHLDLDILRQRLRKISSDITLEDHNAWSQKLLVFGKSLNFVTLLIGIFIVLCVTVIVGLVTKAALQAYRETLDILRLLGAKNSYIARIFQRQILKSSFWGGVWGTLFSIPTAYAFVMVLKYLGLDGLAWNGIIWSVLALVLAVPVALTCISLMVSRLTIAFHLRALDL